MNRTIIPTLFVSCLTLAGCGFKSPDAARRGSEPSFYPRGGLADAGSEVYRRERPDFATEIPKLLMQYEQSIGDDARELEAIGLLHDIAAYERTRPHNHLENLDSLRAGHGCAGLHVSVAITIGGDAEVVTITRLKLFNRLKFDH